MKIRAARHRDLSAVRALLAAAGLPDEDIGAHLATLLVGEQARAVVAAGALEPLGTMALLRSVAVAPPFRGRGWGRRMTRRLLDDARGLGIREAWLLTLSAGEFFAAIGFTPVGRDAAPAAVRATRQFAGLCPATATLMHCALETPPASTRAPATPEGTR